MLPIQEKLLTGYNRPFRKLKKLKAVIIHWTANTDAKANALAHYFYFNRKKATPTVYGSAHYVVDDSNIYRYVPDNEVAYHVGAKKYKQLIYDTIGVPIGDSPNNYMIGIEMCVNSDGDFSKTRQNTIELTNYLIQKYNLTTENVFRHFDITGKDCPQMMLEESIWNQFLNEVDGINTILINLKVNTAELNVRTGAGTNFPIKRKLHNGDLATKIGQDGLWYKIGDAEWVHSNYVIVL